MSRLTVSGLLVSGLLITGCGSATHHIITIDHSASSRRAVAHEIAQREAKLAAEERQRRREDAEAAKRRAARRSAPSVTQPQPQPQTTPSVKEPPPSEEADEEVCFPGYTLPAVHLPAVRIPAETIPGYTVEGHTYPPIHLRAVYIPAKTLPARTVKESCLKSVSSAFAPKNTTVMDGGYRALDPKYSERLTQKYWEDAGSASKMPDPTASGFGELNEAGYPKNQYVRPYVRSDGTQVEGYWRNSPTDGLPTCQVINC